MLEALQSLLQRANCVCAASTSPIGMPGGMTTVPSFDQLTNASRFQSDLKSIHSH